MPLRFTKKNISQADKVVEYILTREVDELETLLVKSIACNFNMSRNRLWRCFKKEKNMTLEEYIFRVKITHAAVLLQENMQLSVKEIGEKLGYYSCNYFICVFKRYFGTTPGRYRELKSNGKGWSYLAHKNS